MPFLNWLPGSIKPKRVYLKALLLSLMGLLLGLLVVQVGPSLVPRDVLAQPLVDFGSFEFKKLNIKDKKKDFKDSVDLRGTCTLGVGSDGIDPVNESVDVTREGVGCCTVFTQIVPPCAYKANKKGCNAGR